MYVNYNNNPQCMRVGDCVVRAISTALGQSWNDTYIDLCLCGLLESDMPSSNNVWGKYLKSKGYERMLISDDYNVRRFSNEYNENTYILALDGHVVAVIDGNYYDTWDSGEEIPIYIWRCTKK